MARTVAPFPPDAVLEMQQGGTGIDGSTLVSGQILIGTQNGLAVGTITGPGVTISGSTITITGAGGGTVNTVVFAQSPYAVAASDYVVKANAAAGNIQINLPAAASSTNRIIIVKKIDATANTVTIKANAAETIDGLNTQVLTIQYASLSLIGDGTTWSLL